MTPDLLSMIPLSAEVLSRTPKEAIDLIVRLLEQNAALRVQVEALEARVEALEAMLKKIPPIPISLRQAIPLLPQRQSPSRPRKKRASARELASNACAQGKCWSIFQSLALVDARLTMNPSLTIFIRLSSCRKLNFLCAISFCTEGAALIAEKPSKRTSLFPCAQVSTPDSQP